MKTLNVHHETSNLTARDIDSARTVRSTTRRERATITSEAIERQLDEILRTFSARWEW